MNTSEKIVHYLKWHPDHKVQRFLIWSMATRRRFALTWGACLFGGIASIMTMFFEGGGGPRSFAWLLAVPLWLVGGYLWGNIMWLYYRFTRRRTMTRRQP